LLAELGHEVIVADAQGTAAWREPQERRKNKKDDRPDAQALARIDPELLYRCRVLQLWCRRVLVGG
jgi:hypothetical protein